MRENWIQLGSTLVPMTSVHHIDLEYQNEGTPTSRSVRVWYNQGFTIPGQVPTPAFADFRGNDANQIRRSFHNMRNGGSLTVLLQGDNGEGADAPKARSAGK